MLIVGRTLLMSFHHASAADRRVVRVLLFVFACSPLQQVSTTVLPVIIIFVLQMSPTETHDIIKTDKTTEDNTII